MRYSVSRSGLLVAALLVPFAVALAAGGGSSGGGSVGGAGLPSSAQRTPEQRAKAAYNSGVRLVGKADAASEDAAAAKDPAKRQKYADKAKQLYRDARDTFTEAIVADASFYQAWNYVGYTRRQLGDYAGALQAYDRALSLNPEYAEAIEYRGHAYLGLHRLGEAKDAYLALFASNRTLADKLLGAMRDWSAQAAPGDGIDAAQLAEFRSWVEERTKIAATTAGLSPEGAAARWN